MPTPNDSIRPTTPRPHPSCPDIDTTLLPEQSNSTSNHSVTATEAYNDDETTPTKARVGKVHEENTIDSGTSRSTTAEPESKTDDPYYYPVSSNLGFALTPDTALTFSHANILRKRPSYLSSIFRPGSRFVGTQTERKIYNVEVQIKQVDMRQSTMCGYLKIDGLATNCPSMTTFFEGEIIGPHFSFITKHPDWGTTPRTDLVHWDRFPAFKQYAKLAKDPDFHLKNISQKENVFMRWKERFLVVPDHKSSEITGASYAGFYYICFDQINGTITGIYFHEEHDKFQSLNLKHVHDYGLFPNIEWA